MTKRVLLILLAAAAVLLAACAGQTDGQTADGGEDHSSGAAMTDGEKPEKPAEAEEPAKPAKPANPVKTLEPFSDVRYFSGVEDTRQVYQAEEFRAEDIITFTFNRDTVLQGSEELQEQILEDGKDPGLGVRALHEQGITGEGVRVAIIDQNLLLDHPEFADRIAAYYDTGCEQDEDSGSMHAPAVTSILAGESLGVAPGATVYFAAAPSWLKDSEYYAKGLYWIIEENKKLPEGDKIRVVSVSAAPSGDGSLFTKNLDMWDESVEAAQEEGILVLDCRSREDTGICFPAFYDPEDRDNCSACTGGFPSTPDSIPAGWIGVPTSYRTVAEEYFSGEFSYQYTGQGGLSWGIPYAAGVLALGWQVNPALSGDQMVDLLFSSCATTDDGSSIINPPAFIEAVRATLG